MKPVMFPSHNSTTQFIFSVFMLNKLVYNVHHLYFAELKRESLTTSQAVKIDVSWCGGESETETHKHTDIHTDANSCNQLPLMTCLPLLPAGS